jgi:hypothetical protein
MRKDLYSFHSKIWQFFCINKWVDVVYIYHTTLKYREVNVIDIVKHQILF